MRNYMTDDAGHYCHDLSSKVYSYPSASGKKVYHSPLIGESKKISDGANKVMSTSIKLKDNPIVAATYDVGIMVTTINAAVIPGAVITGLGIIDNRFNKERFMAGIRCRGQIKIASPVCLIMMYYSGIFYVGGKYQEYYESQPDVYLTSTKRGCDY